MDGVKRRKTDIIQLVEKSIRDLPTPDNVRISFKADLSDPVVWVESERMQKALMDIAANAIEAMPGGGELSLNIKDSTKQLIIRLADTGTGITRENMDNLFVPFFTTKPAGEGMGLGLPTAFATVRMHGGTIEVDSNAESENGPTGTVVTITIPRGEEPQLDMSRLIIHED